MTETYTYTLRAGDYPESADDTICTPDEIQRVGDRWIAVHAHAPDSDYPSLGELLADYRIDGLVRS